MNLKEYDTLCNVYLQQAKEVCYKFIAWRYTPELCLHVFSCSQQCYYTHLN